MATTSNASAKPEVIDLKKFTPEQLLQIQQEFEQEMSNIRDSLTTLHGCKAKYAGSKEALEAFQPKWTDRQILVPLTSSMYVPGRIKDLDNFVIDIGTGYYIEKDLAGSKDYFQRRIEYVQEQIEKIEKIQLQKTQFLNSVTAVLEIKQAAAVKAMQQNQPTKSTA